MKLVTKRAMLAARTCAARERPRRQRCPGLLLACDFRPLTPQAFTLVSCVMEFCRALTPIVAAGYPFRMRGLLLLEFSLGQDAGVFKSPGQAAVQALALIVRGCRRGW